MSTTEVIDPADVICGLKAAVTALECYHHMNLLKDQEKSKQEKLSPPSMYMMIPIDGEKDSKMDKNRSRPKCVQSVTSSTLKRRVSADKMSEKNKRIVEKNDNCSINGPYTPRVKFPEMRSGILFRRCNCVHRDGLQDSCPLTQCQGQDECLVKPWPVCPPGMFLRSRHPDLYSTPPNPDSITY